MDRTRRSSLLCPGKEPRRWILSENSWLLPTENPRTCRVQEQPEQEVGEPQSRILSLDVVQIEDRTKKKGNGENNVDDSNCNTDSLARHIRMLNSDLSHTRVT